MEGDVPEEVKRGSDRWDGPDPIQEDGGVIRVTEPDHKVVAVAGVVLCRCWEDTDNGIRRHLVIVAEEGPDSLSGLHGIGVVGLEGNQVASEDQGGGMDRVPQVRGLCCLVGIIVAIDVGGELQHNGKEPIGVPHGDVLQQLLQRSGARCLPSGWRDVAVLIGEGAGADGRKGGLEAVSNPLRNPPVDLLGRQLGRLLGSPDVVDQLHRLHVLLHRNRREQFVSKRRYLYPQG